jgi:hypothetical protein
MVKTLVSVQNFDQFLSVERQGFVVSESERDFRKAIQQIYRRFSLKLDPLTASKILVEVADELAVPIQVDRQTQKILYVVEEKVLRITYEQPKELAEELPNIVEFRALFVPLSDLPLMEDLRVQLVAGMSGDYVQVPGRVVQSSAAGTGIQILDVDAHSEERLTKMANSATFQPRPTTGSFAAIPSPPVQPIRPSTITGQIRLPLARLVPNRSPDLSWDKDASTVKIFVELAVQGETGLLEFSFADDNRRVLALHDGALVDCDSRPSRPKESLRHLLHGSKQIDSGQFNEIQAYCESHGVGDGEALLNLQFLDIDQVRKALKTRNVYLLRHVWPGGASVDFYRLDDLPVRTMSYPIGLAELVYDRLKQVFADASEQEQERAYYHGYKLTRADHVPDTGAVRLPKEVSKILSMRLLGAYALQDFERMTKMKDETLLSALHLLRVLGIFERSGWRPTDKLASQRLERVEFIHASIDSGDHFLILGLHWSTYGDEIEKVYSDLKSRLNPAALEGKLDERQMQKVHEVVERVGTAYSFLRDKSRRRALRESLADMHHRQASIDMFEKQADTAKMQRDIRGAIDFYERIHELNPAHPTAKSELTLLRTLIPKK